MRVRLRCTTHYSLGVLTVWGLSGLNHGLSATLTAARQGLAEQGMTLSAGADLSDALRSSYPQRLLVGYVQKKTYTALLQSLHLPQPAEVRGAGGPGVGWRNTWGWRVEIPRRLLDVFSRLSSVDVDLFATKSATVPPRHELVWS